MRLILQENGIEYASHDWSGAPPQVVIDNDLHYLRTAIQDSRVIYALVPAGQVARFGSFGGEIPIAAKPAPPEFQPEPLNGYTTPNRPLAAAPPPAEREACAVGMGEYRSVRDERDKLKKENNELGVENVRLRVAVLNQCADNLCWFSDPNVGRALPEPEFLESCRRYRKQIADANGEYAGGRTIAQLEAENEKLRNATVAHSNNVVKQLQLQVQDLTDRLRHVREQRNENLRTAQKYQGKVFRLENVQARLEALEMDRAGRFAADKRAVELWRAADPEHHICMPDHADLCLWLLNLLDSSHAREEATQARGAAHEQQAYISQLRLAADLVGIAAGKDTELAELRTRRDELLASNNRLVEEKRTLEGRWWAEHERAGKALRGLRAIRDILDTQIPRQGQGDAATRPAAITCPICQAAWPCTAHSCASADSLRRP